MKEKEKEKKSEGESNILVAIRIRPLNQRECGLEDENIVRTQDNLIIILDPVEIEFEMENKKMLDVLHRSKEQRYAFDKIYRNETSQKIYEETVKGLIRNVVEGKNATVFAYGPTGTGKTYTMIGNQEVYGLNVLAIRDIFNLIEIDSEYNYSVNITYVEIYNEMIRDLLIPTSGYLELRDDNDKGITIAGVTEFKAESTEQVMNLLLIGNKRRTTEATNANQTSSRSHAVFQININKTPRTKNTSVQTLTGKLSLIDLAGSERGTVTENRGIRLMEGAKINRSLLALANCINALGDKNRKGFFVPYRDSKLTRLLKDSLGGNCKTVMIVNISPASSQFEETINTLKYANRAKNIKTKALTNKKLVSIHISEYKNIINDLRQQIDQLKMRLQKNPQAYSIESANDGANSISSKENQTNGVCTCGRMQEKQEIKKVKQQIFENFNERIQLRKALMEIEEQNTLNFIEIKKKQNEILFLRKNEPTEDTPEGMAALQQIRSLEKVVQTLKLSTKNNLLKRKIKNLQLMESMSSAKKIREEIFRKVKSKQNRDFLEIIIQNHVLELQNIELEINLQIQDRIIANLKNISDSQRNLIQQKGFDMKFDEQMSDNMDIELEIEEEDDNDLVEGADNIGIEQEEGKQYKDDFEEQIEKQLLQDRQEVEAKKEKNMKIKESEEEEQNFKFKTKQADQSSNIDLGIVGVNKIKKRERTVTDQKLVPIQKNFTGSSKDQPVENSLDFNLKGVNLRLNQKVPFAMAPQIKKKK